MSQVAAKKRAKKRRGTGAVARQRRKVKVLEAAVNTSLAAIVLANTLSKVPKRLWSVVVATAMKLAK